MTVHQPHTVITAGYVADKAARLGVRVVSGHKPDTFLLMNAKHGWFLGTVDSTPAALTWLDGYEKGQGAPR